MAREHELEAARASGQQAVAEALHVDDLSSDDEEAGNAIGRVPLRWYEDYEHIGYDVHGKQVAKRAAQSGLDVEIARRDDPKTFQRTVYDALNDREHVLSDRELEIIRRIQSGAYAHPEHDAHPDMVHYYTGDIEQQPLSFDNPSKHAFTPSRWEMMKVAKIVKGLKDGTILPRAEREKKKAEAKAAAEAAHLIWSAADDDLDGLDARKGPMHIAAPKLPLPGHASSYRPPDEYLFSAEEEAAWDKALPSDRDGPKPVKFDNLRSVGAYKGLVRDRFERCLDLYLCPRSFKRRLNIDPESLVPKLPSPKDLRPFPTAVCTRFAGHRSPVRALCPSHDGQYICSGDDDGVLKLWEVATGRCLRSWTLSEAGTVSEDAPASLSASAGDAASTGGGGAAVVHVCWNPNRLHHVVAVAAGSSVFLVATGTGGAEGGELTDALLSAAETTPAAPPLSSSSAASSSSAGPAVTWVPAAGAQGKAQGKAASASTAAAASHATPSGRAGRGAGVRAVLRFPGPVTSLCWHRKGDYLATGVPSALSGNVMVHQVSKRSSQAVIKKQLKTVAALAFHPSQPIFFVATQQHVRVYHLVEQRIIRKLLTGCKHVSSMAVHPSGDHVLVGSYDRRVVWFDLDRGAMPFKTLKYHTKALRGVGFSGRYPLMASCADDGTTHVFHATVHADLAKDPFIVPVKILANAHPPKAKGDHSGVLALVFHPTQPWLFSAGADGDVVLFQDL